MRNSMIALTDRGTYEMGLGREPAGDFVGRYYDDQRPKRVCACTCVCVCV